jgi:hypothetical protein
MEKALERALTKKASVTQDRKPDINRVTASEAMR